MNGFEPGPWDTRAQADGAHVFSKKRKLLYGADHDKAELDESGDASTYGQREHHRMHNLWRKGALKQLDALAKKEKGDVKLVKRLERGGKVAWQGASDLGKHFLLVEELIDLKVLSLHQDEQAKTYAQVHRDALRKAIAFFASEEAAAAAAAAAAEGGGGPAAPAPSAEESELCSEGGAVGVEVAGAKRKAEGDPVR